MSRVEHDWFKPSRFSDDEECARCGTLRFEYERDLSASQSTMTWCEYYKNGKRYDHDPGCCKRA